MVAYAEHCLFCFDVLVSHLSGVAQPKKPNFEDLSVPLFVTWNVQSRTRSGSERLRGCIGNFNAQSLHAGLKEYALTSALRDHRFDPVALKDVPSLTCGVSLLTDFTDAEDYLDWEIGTHGIWIEFYDDRHRRRTATYLPEVAPEQRWSKVETIDALLRKGGYRDEITEEVRQRISLTRYRSSKYKVTYADWVKAREKTPLVKLIESAKVPEVTAIRANGSGFGSWWGRH